MWFLRQGASPAFRLGAQLPPAAVLLLLLSLQILGLWTSEVAARTVHKWDVDALVALRKAWGSPASLQTWQGEDPCAGQWRGVTCTERTADSSEKIYVKALELSNLRLSGPLSTKLGKLLKIEKIDLSNNRFFGSIPRTIENLRGLQHLDLSFNMLSSNIPTRIKFCQQLTFLDLSANDLNGTIPGSLARLTNLLSLNLGTNENFNSTFPPALTALTTLQDL
ncbi:hypothetical protein CLOM_g23880 [Closterium sp. NIES-68]|nr:hypothetical protein CLOM_g23880 [Closterium sp. NIES-68]